MLEHMIYKMTWYNFHGGVKSKVILPYINVSSQEFHVGGILVRSMRGWCNVSAIVHVVLNINIRSQ